MTLKPGTTMGRIENLEERLAGLEKLVTETRDYLIETRAALIARGLADQWGTSDQSPG
jgi:hypothetical protein